MTSDQAEQAHLAYLILREKDALERLETAREEVLLWAKRGKLALQASRTDLAREAKQRALEAKQAFEQARLDLDSIRMEKDVLMQTRDLPEEEATMRAEMLVEQFRLAGFSPEEQEAKEIAKRMEAEFDLVDLKSKLHPRPAAEKPIRNLLPVATDVEAVEAETPADVEAVEAGMTPDVEAVEVETPPDVEAVEAETPADVEAVEAGTPSEGGESDPSGDAEAGKAPP